MCKCDKIPDFEILLISYRRGGNRPWSLTAGFVNWQVPIGKVSYNLAGQAWNILPGDVLYWEYSYNAGATWLSLSAGWQVPNGQVSWTEEDSWNPSIRVPNGEEEYWWRLTVQREGCDDFVKTREMQVLATSPVLATGYYASEYRLYLDGDLHHQVTAAFEWKRNAAQMGIDTSVWMECNVLEREEVGDYLDALDGELLDCMFKRLYCRGFDVKDLLT